MVCFIIFCVVGALCWFYIYKKCTQKPIDVKSESVSKTSTRPFLSKGVSDVQSNVSKSSRAKSTTSSNSVQHNTYLFEDVSLKSEKWSSRSNSNTHEETSYSGSGRFGGGGSTSSWSDSSSDSCSSSDSSSSSCD